MIAYIVDYIDYQRNSLGSDSLKGFKRAMEKSPLTLPLLVLGLFTSIFLILLCIYHTKLLVLGRTTHEDLREPGYKIRPFDNLSVTKNVYSMLFVRYQRPRFIPRSPYVEPSIKYPLKKSRSEHLS